SYSSFHFRLFHLPHLLRLFSLSPGLFCLCLLLSFLVGHLRLLLKLAKPAEEERGHHHEINQPRDQQEGTGYRLVRHRRQTGLREPQGENILLVKHSPREYQQKGVDVHWLAIQEGV